MTKKGLYKTSAYFSIIISIILAVVTTYELLKKGYFGQSLTGHGMITGVGENKIVGYTCLGFSVINFIAGTLMFVTIKHFHKSHYKRLLIASSFFTILGAVCLNINAIALYLAYGTEEELANKLLKPFHAEQKPANQDAKQLKQSLIILRKMRENGEITDEEFKKVLYDLIKGEK